MGPMLALLWFTIEARAIDRFPPRAVVDAALDFNVKCRERMDDARSLDGREILTWCGRFDDVWVTWRWNRITPVIAETDRRRRVWGTLNDAHKAYDHATRWYFMERLRGMLTVEQWWTGRMPACVPVELFNDG